MPEGNPISPAFSPLTPSSTDGGIAGVGAALARGDRYRRCFPAWQWGRRGGLPGGVGGR